MKRSLLFPFFILVSSFNVMGQIMTDSVQKKKYLKYVKVDTTKITILGYDNAEYSKLERCAETNLTIDDLKEIEYLFLQFRDDYNGEQIKQYNALVDKHKNPHIPLFLDIEKVKRQYIPIINCKVEKEVWINCFCNPMGKNWKTEIIKSSGEKMCNFKLIINLTTGKYYDFRLLPFKNGI